jgi:tetratricopeptide (TPR) repeat protein
VLTLVRLARVALGLDRPADAQAWASAASAVPAAPHELEPAVALLAELVADAMDRGDWDAARTCALAAMACHPVDPGARVQFAAVLATVAWTGRDAHTALRWGRQALEALGGSGHPLRAVLLHDLGVLATEAGEPETARRYLEEALALERANDDQDGIIGALLALADLARRSGGGGPGSMATAT